MQNLLSPRMTLFVVLAACGLAAWYVVPRVHTDLQFVLRCAIFAVPMLLGAQAVSEMQEEFAAATQAECFASPKAQLPSQLVDMATGTTLALVHPDGTVEIVQPDWYDESIV